MATRIPTMTEAKLRELAALLPRCVLCGGPATAIGMFLPDTPTDLYDMPPRADVLSVDPEGTAVAYATCDQHPPGAATAAQVEAVLTSPRVGTFHITYATGKVFELTGEFRVMEPFPGSELLVPVVIDSHGTAKAMDPRAVVRDSAGLVLFTGCSTEQLEADVMKRRGPRVVRGAGKTGIVAGE